MKLLIVEDDPMSRRMLMAMLAACPLDIVTAADGSEALAALAQYSPAMVMLDWVLPGPSGLEICQRIRQRNTHEHPYIVMVTSRDSTDDVVAAFNAGADDYVTKPFHAAQLRARITGGIRRVLREQTLAQEHADIQAALSRMHTMPQLVPICSCCKRVNDAPDTWLPVDRYIEQRAGVHFSHGVCPSCAPSLMEPKPASPDYDRR